MYLSPTSMLPTGSSPVPLPPLRMNRRTLFPARALALPSKHYRGLLMLQQKQRLLPRFLHPGSRDPTISCEQILTPSQGQEAQEN
jgi:hypothetical protein